MVTVLSGRNPGHQSAKIGVRPLSMGFRVKWLRLRLDGQHGGCMSKPLRLPNTPNALLQRINAVPKFIAVSDRLIGKGSCGVV